MGSNAQLETLFIGLLGCHGEPGHSPAGELGAGDRRWMFWVVWLRGVVYKNKNVWTFGRVLKLFSDEWIQVASCDLMRLVSSLFESWIRTKHRKPWRVSSSRWEGWIVVCGPTFLRSNFMKRAITWYCIACLQNATGTRARRPNRQFVNDNNPVGCLAIILMATSMDASHTCPR